MKKAFTVFYSEGYGELEKIEYSEDFLAETLLMQADIVSDLQESLIERYRELAKNELGLIDNKRREEYAKGKA